MRVSRRLLSIAYQHNIRMLDMTIGTPWSSYWVLHLLWNVPVTVTDRLTPLFVKKSTFTSRCIVHPEGGGATRLVCESCGAEYPYVASPSPCSFCAVMKESGFTINIGHRTREWRWSEWGWAVKRDGYYVGEAITEPMRTRAIRPTRFKAKHKAYELAMKLEAEEWDKVGPATSDQARGYRIEVNPYPIKPVQPARPEMTKFGGWCSNGWIFQIRDRRCRIQSNEPAQN